MVQDYQKKQQANSTGSSDNFLDAVNQFINNSILNAPKNDKIAYGLIACGIIFIIIGAILW